MILLYIFSLLAIVGTLLPLSDRKHWIIRGQSYFRFWYALLHIILIVSFIFFTPFVLVHMVILPVQICLLILCLRDIIPFTKFYPKEIKSTPLGKIADLHIMVFNVYQNNNQYQKLIDLALKEDPDFLLLLETDHNWDQALQPIHDHFGHSVKEIKSNTYGMILFSKLPILKEKVAYRTDDNIPSISMLTEYKNRSLRIIGLHPLAPIPGESLSTKQKDKEFKNVAKDIAKKESEEVVIVIGDLNDVVWSKASKAFKKTSGLKDPRIGRGTYSTFPTYSPIRFPLDHIFCSEELQLSEIRRLPDIGSDHYPITFTFYLPSIEQ